MRVKSCGERSVAGGELGMAAEGKAGLANAASGNSLRRSGAARPSDSAALLLAPSLAFVPALFGEGRGQLGLGCSRFWWSDRCAAILS